MHLTTSLPWILTHCAALLGGLTLGWLYARHQRRTYGLALSAQQHTGRPAMLWLGFILRYGLMALLTYGLLRTQPTLCIPLILGFASAHIHCLYQAHKKEHP